MDHLCAIGRRYLALDPGDAGIDNQHNVCVREVRGDIPANIVGVTVGKQVSGHKDLAYGDGVLFGYRHDFRANLTISVTA